MTEMLCRNRVRDYAVWKAEFDAEAERHREVGMSLRHLWRCVDEPNNVFFVLGVEDVDRALVFLNSAESAQIGERAGVIDGEVFFVESAMGG